MSSSTAVRPDALPRTGNPAPAAREQLIPLRKDELIDLLIRRAELDAGSAAQFRRLCRLFGAIFHHEFRVRLDQLKRLYAPFDPDTETRPLPNGESRTRMELIDAFLDELTNVLTAANFYPLPPEQLEKALSGATDWGLDLEINRDIFDRLLIYVRGASRVTRTRRDLGTWFRRRDIELEMLSRVVLAVKLRASEFRGEQIDSDNVYLKQFREIPLLDLEMLLPGTRPRMRLLDAGKIGGSSVAGIFSLSKMAIETVFAGKLKWLMVGVGALAYAVQSFLGYRRTKAAYVYNMAQQLYYQNLDNNCGVFCRIIDEAEDEETKEAILAYYFLWRGAEEEWTPDRLATEVERLLEERTGESCRFQSRDVIAKLTRLGVLRDDTNRLAALDVEKAVLKLAERWTTSVAGELAE